MKLKILILTLNIAIASLCQSQPRRDYTSFELKSEFGNSLEWNVMDNNVKVASQSNKFGIWFYYFGKDDRIDFCTLIPKNQIVINSMIDQLNTEGVIVGQNEWVLYTLNGKCNVKFIFLESKDWVFIYD